MPNFVLQQHFVPSENEPGMEDDVCITNPAKFMMRNKSLLKVIVLKTTYGYRGENGIATSLVRDTWLFYLR